jgi:hypothetical protein
MGLRSGWLSASFGHVTAHLAEDAAATAAGVDLDAVQAWVEVRDGHVDNPQLPKMNALQPGRTFEPADTTDRRRFVFPAAALEA